MFIPVLRCSRYQQYCLFFFLGTSLSRPHEFSRIFPSLVSSKASTGWSDDVETGVVRLTVTRFAFRIGEATSKPPLAEYSSLAISYAPKHILLMLRRSVSENSTKHVRQVLDLPSSSMGLQYAFADTDGPEQGRSTTPQTTQAFMLESNFSQLVGKYLGCQMVGAMFLHAVNQAV